jgi:serine/threonine-protein kinase
VKVLDFGVAQTAARADTDAGVVRGTYGYMGPEQVRGRPLDKRADVFALGVILYELTTGRRLFRGSDIQVMTQVVERDVRPPSADLPNYPRDLEQIVLRALQRDRGARTPSAFHMAMSLDQFCMQTGLVAGPLVVSRYVRSLFPYERAHEAGMGIARDSDQPVSPEDREEQELVRELRAMQGKSSRPAQAGRGGDAEEEEIALDELLLEEEALAPAGEGHSSAPPDSLGLDEFDEDSEVKPVVLLSPKPKARTERSDGAFMSDLERRLEEDADSGRKPS